MWRYCAYHPRRDKYNAGRPVNGHSLPEAGEGPHSRVAETATKVGGVLL